MNNTLKNILIFSAGVGVGAFAVWEYFSNRYLISDEIEEPLEAGSEKNPGMENSKNNYSELYENAKNAVDEYGGDVEGIIDDTPGEPVVADSPYVISPSEFGETDFEEESLTWYSDGVLTDDYDEKIEDVEGMVGSDSLKRFEEYDDCDVVYVRNERLRCDYEITRDLRKYSDVLEEKPYLKRLDE